MTKREHHEPGYDPRIDRRQPPPLFGHRGGAPPDQLAAVAQAFEHAGDREIADALDAWLLPGNGARLAALLASAPSAAAARARIPLPVPKSSPIWVGVR